jgi:hypothetical protein
MSVGSPAAPVLLVSGGLNETPLGASSSDCVTDEAAAPRGSTMAPEPELGAPAAAVGTPPDGIAAARVPAGNSVFVFASEQAMTPKKYARAGSDANLLRDVERLEFAIWKVFPASLVMSSRRKSSRAS